jgi:hypothetical protein
MKDWAYTAQSTRTKSSRWTWRAINRSNLLVLESKADMKKRGQASPDDGDTLALTFAQPVERAEVEEEDEEEFAVGRYGGGNSG